MQGLVLDERARWHFVFSLPLDLSGPHCARARGEQFEPHGAGENDVSPRVVQSLLGLAQGQTRLEGSTKNPKSRCQDKNYD